MTFEERAMLAFLGYAMVAFGMFVIDFRNSFATKDTDIYYKKIAVESLAIFLVYYLFLKDALVNKTFTVFIPIMLTERVLLGANLLMGMAGYDRLYKLVTKIIKKKGKDFFDE